MGDTLAGLGLGGAVGAAAAAFLAPEITIPVLLAGGVIGGAGGAGAGYFVNDVQQNTGSYILIASAAFVAVYLFHKYT